MKTTPPGWIELVKDLSSSPREFRSTHCGWPVKAPAVDSVEITRRFDLSAKIRPREMASPDAASANDIRRSSPDVLDRRKQLLDYLERVSTGAHALISPDTASLAKQAWNTIALASKGEIPIPAACTGPDGEMFYSWDQGRHHLELEIIPGQPAEFFYRDRETEQFWGEDYTIGDALPAKVVDVLSLFR